MQIAAVPRNQPKPASSWPAGSEGRMAVSRLQTLSLPCHAAKAPASVGREDRTCTGQLARGRDWIGCTDVLDRNEWHELSRTEELLGGVAVALVETSRAWPRLVVGLCALLTASSIYVAATILDVDTDSDRLLSRELPVRQTNLALAEAFPELQHNLVVMVEAEDPADARSAAEQLAARLRQEPERYPGVLLLGIGLVLMLAANVILLPAILNLVDP